MESSYNKYHELKAFNIPKIDLIEVLQEKGVASVRAYLGVKMFENEETGSKIYKEKLMFVGVDSKGKDMISTIGSDVSDPAGNDIYDFTESCPDLCDESSPMNGE